MSDRRIDPFRNSLGSDLFVVERYDPQFQTCDLAPASINQRGKLSQVPIFCMFGGAWELSSHYEPSLGLDVDTEQWGNAPRGARWGMNVPIQPGDMARVEYQGESASDPVITAFFRWRGDFSPAWLANQVFSESNEFTRETPDSDDVLADRFDILLPSGAWMRSTQDGAWTICTPPVNRPNAWFSLFPNGQIKLKARDDDDYQIHLEFDPRSKEGRISVGALEDSTFIEFKDGNLRIKAQHDIRLDAERIVGNAIPQLGTAGGLGALLSNPGAAITGGSLPGLAAAAAGQLVLNGGGGTAGLNLLASTDIDGDIRNRISDMILDNGRQWLDDTIGGLRELTSVEAIADQLQKITGVQSLLGELPTLFQRLDLSSLSMVRALGLPSWIGDQIKDALDNSSTANAILNNLELPDPADYTNNTKLLEDICRYAGAQILSGSSPSSVRDLIKDEYEGTIRTLLTRLATTPIHTTRRSANSEPDWLQSTAIRLGRYVLTDNDALGGRTPILNLNFLQNTDLDPGLANQVRTIGRQMERYASNPHGLVGELPTWIENNLPNLASIPVELRDAIAKLPASLVSQIPELARGLLSGENEDEDHPFHTHTADDDNLGIAASIIGTMPDELKQLIADLPDDLMLDVSQLPDRLRSTVLTHAQGLIDRLPDSVICSIFGGASSLTAGIFDVKVLRTGGFSFLPQLGNVLERWVSEEFHRSTEAPPIERFQEYGALNLQKQEGM